MKWKSELWVYVKFPKHLDVAIGQERMLSLPFFNKRRYKQDTFLFPLFDNYPKDKHEIKWVLWKQAARKLVAALWHCVGDKSSFSSCLQSMRLQTILPIFKNPCKKSVCSLGTYWCLQHGTWVQQIECLMYNVVWMFLNCFFSWKKPDVLQRQMLLLLHKPYALLLVVSRTKVQTLYRPFKLWHNLR